jgi:hypothetical protein
MAGKSKGRKHIYRSGAKKNVKRGFEKRYGKRKGEYAIVLWLVN